MRAGLICPSHGEVLPLRGECPWGCGHVFVRELSRQVPLVSWQVQRATEAMTLFYLTEPRGEVSA